MCYVVIFYLGDLDGDGFFILQLIDCLIMLEIVIQMVENLGCIFWCNLCGIGVYYFVVDVDGNYMVYYFDFCVVEDILFFVMLYGVQDFVSVGLFIDGVVFLFMFGGQLVYWDGDNWIEVGDLFVLISIICFVISLDLLIVVIVVEEQVLLFQLY